jgi:hypothetical protein
VICRGIAREFLTQELVAVLHRCFVVARQWKFASLNPLHTGQDVSKTVDRASLPLDDWFEPATLRATIREFPTAKQFGQLRSTDPGRTKSLHQNLDL